MTYSEFITGCPTPRASTCSRATPLEGQMCLEISPLIIYPIIDRLLGGSNAGPVHPAAADDADRDSG
jgi:flagellar motor switch protein FliM